MLDYFTRRKQLQEMEEQAIAAGRLPPGQSLTTKWPVLHAGSVPQFDPDSWRFNVSGLVKQSETFSWDDLRRLPRSTSKSDIHCVTRWSKLDNEWEGIAATDLLKLVEVQPDATHVMVHAPDYSANLPLHALRSEDAIFAFKHNGTDLDLQHGYPMRLVIPDRYFWKSVKWVNGLQFLAADEPGFWERLGYHNQGDPFAEERFA